MFPRSFHWTDFCESWYWGLSWKSVDKSQVWLKSDIAKYVDIVDSSVKYCAAWQQCQRNPLLHFIGDTQRFTSLKRYLQFSNNNRGNVLLHFLCNSVFAKTAHCYVVRTLNVFFLFTCSWATKNRFVDRGPEVRSISGTLILWVYCSGRNEMH
jgi:hypothetical protein